MAEDTILERVRASGVIDVAGPMLVLFSGGRDSLCLLDICVELLGHDEVSALHVNYGLRGNESDADEVACREHCAAMAVDLTVRHETRPERAGNLHAWARDVRYAAGAALCHANGGRLAVAHTVDDQLETILYRLATSPGRGGLLGMPERSGLLIRPLLAAGITRAETTQRCESRGLRWRDDASNIDLGFARTRVREQLVPAFLAVDDRAAGAILQTSALLRDESAVLDEVVTDVLGDDRGCVDVARLSALPAGLARLVLRAMAETIPGADGARAASRVDDVVSLKPGGALDLGGGVRIARDGDCLVVGHTPPLERQP